jgi:hypothetical protein
LIWLSDLPRLRTLRCFGEAVQVCEVVNPALILDGLCLHVLSSFQRTDGPTGDPNRRQRNLTNLPVRSHGCQPQKDWRVVPAGHRFASVGCANPCNDRHRRATSSLTNRMASPSISSSA